MQQEQEGADAEADGKPSSSSSASSSSAAKEEGSSTAIQDLRESLRQAALARSKALKEGYSLQSAMKASDLPVPTGRVVGITRRNWRQYCGSLDPASAASATVDAKRLIADDSKPVVDPASSSASSSSSSGISGGDDAGDDSSSSAGAAAGTSTTLQASKRVLFLPVDAKVPPIWIETRQASTLVDQRIIVAIDRWDANDRYPSGHYVRTVGKIGDRKAETEVILLEHDISWQPFTPEVIACLPPHDFKITPQNSGLGVYRVDCRHLDGLCSIDPPGCKDIDDALHARWLLDAPAPVASSGDYDDSAAAAPAAQWEPRVEVGVHIADVTHFVKQGTAIDNEANKRANTTYLVDKRLDMLPALLTEQLCSLKGHCERFAFSCTWEFRPTGKTLEEVQRQLKAHKESGSAEPPSIVISNTSTAPEGLLGGDEWELVPGSIRFFKSIIHSRHAMTYGQAQLLLDNKPEEDPQKSTTLSPNGNATGSVTVSGYGLSSPITQGVKLLASVSRALKNARKQAGALTLASAETKFLLDSETHDPVSVGAYELKETNSVVEEWMLAANIAVARRIQEAYPRYALLRRHPAPPQRNFDPLLTAAASVGQTIDVSSSKALADSLDRAASEAGPETGKLLRILATRCMMQAAYFCAGEVPDPAERGHYGLATPIYTHFTSPIRRYADVVVHRMLAAAMDIEPLPQSYEDKTKMKRVSDNMNRRHLTAQLASRASAGLYTNIFFSLNGKKEDKSAAVGPKMAVYPALVMKVKENGIVAFVPKLGIEGSIAITDPYSSEKGKKCEFDTTQQTLTSSAPPDGGKPLRVRLFDEVTVGITVESKGDRGRKEVVYRLLEPAFSKAPNDASVAGSSSGSSSAASASASAVGVGHKRSRKEMAGEGAKEEKGTTEPARAVSTASTIVKGGASASSSAGGGKKGRK
jgi:exosome complex exonuclease DIS3/RRP44